MTQEDKELLLKDLCARLPYDVIVDYAYNAFSVRNGHYVKYGSKRILDCNLLDVFISPRQNEKGEYIKPYLRTMSSMTEEEWEELNCIGHIVPLYDGSFGVDMRAYCKNSQPHYRRFSEFSTIEDWLNTHHFDYRGLIEKGLANEATEEMYSLNK